MGRASTRTGLVISGTAAGLGGHVPAYVGRRARNRIRGYVQPGASPGKATRPAWRGGGGGTDSVLLAVLADLPADPRLDETVDVAVEDSARVARLVLGAEVLDHLVRVEDVGAHLVTPARLDVARHLLLHGGLLGLALQKQARLEDAQRGGAVLDLALLVLHRHDDAGRQVRHAHRRVGRVDALATGSTRAEDVDLQLVLGDVDGVVALDERDDLDGGEARLATALIVERADPHEAVRARLDGEVTERVGDVDLEGGRLEARLLGVGGVHDLRRVAVALGPAEVHAHEHLGEVGGVDATRARADRDDGLTLVVLPRQQGADLELADVLLQGGEVALGLL